MPSFRVVRITKADVNSSHEHITHIGFYSSIYNPKVIITVADAIKRIKLNPYEFYVSVPTGTAYVEAYPKGAEKYIKTVPDSTQKGQPSEVTTRLMHRTMKNLLLAIMLFTITWSNTSATHAPHIQPRVDSVYICESRSAYAYHAYECHGLARCTHHIAKITKAQAIKHGYKPCRICY